MCFTWKESENAGRFREIARYHHFGKSEKVFVSFRFVLCYTHEIEGKEGETPLFGTKKWKNNIHIANLSLKLSGPYVYTKAYIFRYTPNYFMDLLFFVFIAEGIIFRDVIGWWTVLLSSFAPFFSRFFLLTKLFFGWGLCKWRKHFRFPFWIRLLVLLLSTRGASVSYGSFVETARHLRRSDFDDLRVCEWNQFIYTYLWMEIIVPLG